ncbi:MAG: hypothetical protein R3F53_23725 [Gammaproteobacteria bacterium]
MLLQKISFGGNMLKVLVSAFEDQSSDRSFEVADLSYDRDDNNFSMRCVMGDDWLQRVNSKYECELKPQIVRFSDNVVFIVFSSNIELDVFEKWLRSALNKVEEGYRTMRG